MNLKSNQILIGVILLLVGAFALFRQSFGVSFGDLPLIIAGGAFLLLYRTKRNSWPLIPGVILLYIGVVRSLPLLATHINTAAMFFVIPGAIFLILFYDKNKRGLLLPGMLLLWFGIFLIVNGLPFAGALPFSVLPVCMGTALIMAYIYGKGSVRNWALYAGGMMFIFSGVATFGLQPVFAVMERLPAAVSAVLIIAGLFIIIKTMRKKG